MFIFTKNKFILQSNNARRNKEAMSYCIDMLHWDIL